MQKILLAVVASGLAFEGVAQTYFQRLKSFGFPQSSGPSGPQAGLVVASNGMLYGTTDFGGAHYAGTVYKLNRDGSGLVVLHSFSKAGGDGWSPYAGLVEARDGALYGTTSRGGNSDHGTVFKLQSDGTGYALLWSFGANDGVGPYGELVEGSDGILYGTTVWGGGSANAGTVFKLKKDGAGFTVLRAFTGTAGDGRNPYGSLCEASDGALYGTTYSGGASNKGAVFKLKKDGSGYAVLHSFSNSSGDGQNPYAGVVEGQDGALYGMTPTGGAGNRGIVFKLQKDGSRYTVLRTFLGFAASDADTPYGRLLKGTDGALYGTTYSGGTSYNNLGTVFKLNGDGSGYALVRSFTGGTMGDGQNPHAGLAQGSDGTLYGTTYSGGSYFAGTVFKMNKNGSGYTLLQSFLAAGGDGQNPPADLIEGRDGVLYGVAQNGGSNNLGVVFRLNKDGSGYSLLRSFLTAPGEGAWPYAGLAEGSDGALYGTTKYGGAYGVVFKLTKDGSSYGILHTFSSAAGEARYPQASLV
ncbi:MAG TPA: choice-of-anchor tandem repeat GloVer-containing protein, partial [Bacillota bacterium]|nr:choice-of-anchor tandem repeat GloVer-containing protein [Bacillota bacterium]